MDLPGFIQDHLEEILLLATRHGACRVRVFGSAARGDVDAASDVDFLVELEPGRSLFDLGGLLSDLQTLLGRSVEVVTPGGLKPRIREGVLGEARPL